MSAYAHILEQHIAADLHDKITHKMSANDCADFCAYVFENTNTDINAQAKAIKPFLDKMGIEAPKAKYKTLGFLPLRIRLESPNWWATKLRIKAKRAAEHLKIKGGLVRKYCSDELLQQTREQQQKMNHWLENTTLKNLKTSEELSLKQVHNTTISNPNLRVCELNVRCKGIAEHYNAQGYRAIFVTVTASGSWHRLATKKDGKGNKHKVLNPRYNRATPKDVQNNFNHRFSLLRTWLSNRDIDMIGIRVAEPHQDGCTHWHFVLWFKSGKEAKQAILAFRQYFLFYEGAPEKGALKNRLKFDTVNPAKGDAVGYILAYINKGITGEHIDSHTDQNGEKIADGKEGAERVRVWAKCWGIRQYQFLGAPPVNLYRELRRIRCDAMGRGKSQQTTVPTFKQFKELQAFYQKNNIPLQIQSMWQAANSGDYGQYIAEYYNAQGQQNINQSQGFLTMACFMFAMLPAIKANITASLSDFVSKFIKPKPSILTHGFKEDLAELAKFYGDVQSVPDCIVNKLESLNGYLEPKSQVYGVCVAGVQMITRAYEGYFKNIWKLITAAPKEQPASIQDLLDAYAGVRAANGTDKDFWGDVVGFGARCGAFERPQAA